MSDAHDDAVMADYYGRRAPLYDHMYREVGPDLRTPMLDDMIATVSGRRVLELASGTGFWSEWLAPFYDQLVGVDVAPEMLAIARARPIAPGKAEFRQGSVYDLAELPADFGAAIAIQWFSHVPAARYAEFFAALHGRLLPGARVFLADNIRQPHETDPLIPRAGTADTYEVRSLPDGSQFEIVKNYFAPGQFERIVPPAARDLRVQFGKTWWWLTYALA